MEHLKELDAVLRIYEANFRILHWNAIGEDFNDSHKSITTEYYELCASTIDNVAEYLCMFNINPCNYAEALDIVTKSENKYLILSSEEKYTRTDIVKYSDTMLGSICELLAAAVEECSNPIDAGIKSELESLLYAFTLQHRYINKRRLG